MIYLAVLAVLMMFRSASAYAGDLEDCAQHLSDGAFSLLRSIDTSRPGGADALSAIASFAGDAQTFSGALGKEDRRAASVAMAAMLSDRASVESAVQKNPGTLDSSAWNSLKDQLASLERRVPPGKETAGAGTPHKAPRGVVPVPSTEPDLDHGRPKVEIGSRVYEDGGVHIKGYIAGFDLKSAGIYDGDRQLSAIQLSPTTEGQRVNFDLALEQATPTETIRVTDALGRSAEARVAPQAVAGAPREGSHEKMIDLGNIRMDGPSSESSLPPVIASVPVTRSGGTSTTEIPSRSPSKRHMHEHSTLAPLSGVQINILGVMQTPSNPEAYQVVGQISGEGIKRAGIYVDGKLVKPVPISADGFTSFDVIFDLLGRDATIRVYGNGTNYQEASIDLNSAGTGTEYGTNPPVAPYAYPVNPYAARNPYGYSPYGAPYGSNPYGYGGYPPNGYPPNGYPPNGYPPPKKPWWQKIF